MIRVVDTVVKWVIDNTDTNPERSSHVAEVYSLKLSRGSIFFAPDRMAYFFNSWQEAGEIYYYEPDMLAKIKARILEMQ